MIHVIQTAASVALTTWTAIQAIQIATLRRRLEKLEDDIEGRLAPTR